MSYRPQNPSSQGPYDPSFYAPLVAAEDRHFWFRRRNQIIETLVRQEVAGRPPGFRVLEVGCGTGNVLRVLKRACPGGLVVGMDFFVEALRWARTRTDCTVVQADLRSLPFGTRFDIIGLFDVLEHLADDREALMTVRGLLAGDGALLLTVPAHASLWSYWDEACRHYRRYSVDDLRSALTQAGLQVEYLTPFMSALYPLMWLRRKLRRDAVGGPDTEAETRKLVERELRIVPGANGLLDWLLRPEARLVASRRKLPLGTSLVALARKMA